MTAGPAVSAKRLSMADRFDDFGPKSDRDLLVMQMTETRHIRATQELILRTQTDIQKDLGAMRIITDRHESRIIHVENMQAERKHQMDSLSAELSKLKEDMLGRMTRMENERLDPIDQKINATNTQINNVRNWIAGAVAVIVFLWFFLSPVYDRLLDTWLRQP